MLNYKENQRRRCVNLSVNLIEDPRGGIYRNSPRDFVLANPENNLSKDIRAKAIEYFHQNKIVWWPGDTISSGHLLSSQISCLNHLFFLRNDHQAALNSQKIPVWL